jgi:hypothetical protein
VRYAQHAESNGHRAEFDVAWSYALIAALGHTVTTHRRDVDELRRRHPAIAVRPDVLYVDEVSFLTAAGSAAGIDAGGALCVTGRADAGQPWMSQPSAARTASMTPSESVGWPWMMRATSG